MPSGRSAGSRPTTTSRSPITITPCRRASSASNSRRASPTPRSRSCTRASRVASHARSHARHRHTTIPEHMPSAHRRYAEWTPARMMREAAKIGPATIALVRGDHEGQAASRAGLPRLSRHPAARPQLRLGTHRGRLPPRQRHRRHHLRLDQIDPAAWARSCLRQREAAGRHHRSNTATSAALATTTEERSRRC